MSGFLDSWASAIGFDGQSPAAVISGASPEMRGYFRRALGPNRALDPGAVREFLEGYIDSIEGGLALRYRDDLWRVERVAGLGGDDRVRSLQAAFAPAATPAEMLASNIQQSLRCQAELLHLPIDPEDPKTMRLIADVANQTLNAGLRAQENVLAAKQDANRVASPRLMERVLEARRVLAVRRSRHD